MSFDKHTINLPSQGRFYNVDEIAIGPLKGKHQIVLAETAEHNFNQKMYEILNDVVTGIDIKQMTTGDALYCLMWLYTSCYSTSYPIEFLCNTCGKPVLNYSIDLTKVKIINVSNDLNYEIKLSTGDTLKLKPFTVAAELEAEKYRSKGNSAYLYRYAVVIDNGKSAIDNLKLLEELPISDVNEIKDFYLKNYHGPDLNMKVTCPCCEGEDQIYVPFLLSNILYKE